jgi:integrase
MKRRRKGDKWPFIRWAEKEQAWKVDARTKDGGQRRFFETRDLAEAWAEQQRIQRKNEGASAFKFRAADRIDAEAAMKMIAPYHISLRECANFYVRHAPTATGEKTIQQIVDELLAVKKSAGMSARYLKDLRIRLNIFCATFGKERAVNVSHKMVDDWITAIPYSGTTRNNYRRLLGVLFGFAVDRKYILQVPISKQSKASVVRGKPGILSVDECARLLSACEDDILPAVAVGMFAGLRPESEIWRLDWNGIDFKRKQIDVEPEATKNTGDNASVRWVDMADNLIEWILPFRQKSGPVSPRGDSYFKRLQRARGVAKITNWPHDALRHCFCSYHYAAYNDAGKTMAQAGHTTPRTFFRHYRARVQPEEAIRFFAIRPVRTAEFLAVVQQRLLPRARSA